MILYRWSWLLEARCGPALGVLSIVGHLVACFSLAARGSQQCSDVRCLFWTVLNYFWVAFTLYTMISKQFIVFNFLVRWCECANLQAYTGFLIFEFCSWFLGAWVFFLCFWAHVESGQDKSWGWLGSNILQLKAPPGKKMIKGLTNTPGLRTTVLNQLWHSEAIHHCLGMPWDEWSSPETLRLAPPWTWRRASELPFEPRAPREVEQLHGFVELMLQASSHWRCYDVYIYYHILSFSLSSRFI